MSLLAGAHVTGEEMLTVVEGGLWVLLLEVPGVLLPAPVAGACKKKLWAQAEGLWECNESTKAVCS